MSDSYNYVLLMYISFVQRTLISALLYFVLVLHPCTCCYGLVYQHVCHCVHYQLYYIFVHPYITGQALFTTVSHDMSKFYTPPLETMMCLLWYMFCDVQSCQYSKFHGRSCYGTMYYSILTSKRNHINFIF